MTNPTEISLGEGDPSRIPLISLTFDDALLLSDAPGAIPSGIDTSTQLTRELRLNIPIVFVTTDTVTEARMAVTTARQGGTGILHHSLSIEEQAWQVEIVKHSETGVVFDPVTCFPGDTIAEVDAKCVHYRISGLSVVDKDGKLAGICINRDMRFEADLNRKIPEIMTLMPLVVTEQGVSGDAALNLLHARGAEKLPIVDGEGHLTGPITVKDFIKKDQYPNAPKDGSGRLLVDAGIDTGEDSWKRVCALADTGVNVPVVDTVHAHNSGALKMAPHVKKEFDENIQIIGGSPAARGAAQAMINASADTIEVGIDLDSICTARVVAGVGALQITAIMKASIVAKKTGVPATANDGIQFFGDIAKALAAGASSVMLSPMLVGTVEAPGEVTFANNKQYKMYHGMGLLGAVQGRGLTGKKRSYLKDRYFQAGIKSEEKLVPEGIEGRVPPRSSTDSIVHRLVGGLCAAIDCTGSATVEQLHDAQFVQITAADLYESHPHNIQTIVEAPNYYQR